MKKTSRVELTQDELREVLNALYKQESKGKLTDKLSAKYVSNLDYKSVINRSSVGFALDAVANQKLMKVIVHGLSVLTGYPEGEIKPETRLDRIGLTSAKREQLRVNVNKYIRSQGKNKFVSTAEMGACKTVNDIYTIAEKKLSS